PKERRTARALLGVPEEGFLVGTVGHIEDVKNLSMLVEVAHEVRRKGLPARFCIVGGGSRTGALRSQIRARGLDDAFILTGERAACWSLPATPACERPWAPRDGPGSCASSPSTGF